MQDSSDSDLEAFRREVRTYVAEYAPRINVRAGVRSPDDAHELELLQRWTASLYQRGYLGAGWPVEHGGRPDHDPARDVVVAEELARARAPLPAGAGSLAAQALIHFGNEQQRVAHLPGIREGRHLWCQLFSEPDAGSDLASLRTRAEADGDEYVVSGQKVWTTNGQWADFGYLLARTDSDVPKHRGITAFILDMRAPGVTVRPLREMTGTSDFNEVFFDQVRVPRSAVIGEPGLGWKVATTSLAEERSGVGAGAIKLRLAWREVASLFARLHADRDGTNRGNGCRDAVRRQELARLYIGIQIASWFGESAMQRSLRGASQPHDAPMGKVLFSELNLAIANFAVSAQAEAGTLVAGEHVPDSGRWQDELLYARAYTIAGGSNEIMRNLLAERALGLPREPA